MNQPSVERVGKIWRLTMSQWLNQPREELFAFFADATNLEKITPDLLNFRVVTPGPISMAPGTLIDYKLKVRGVPIRWRTLIETWEPYAKFTDEQLKGPYKRWHHTHTFTEENGGTRCNDLVEYAPPGGPLAPLINKLVVQRDVEKIFAYRAKVLAEMFGGEQGQSTNP
ncbi:MAG: SRPBCC family protein [Phycisphaeraceae bacterium]|nr:SRPBCC family protein [Phycisphaeraceae bacterium]